MKKIIIIFLFFACIFANAVAFAAVTGITKGAISKYKAGNYAGCNQDLYYEVVMQKSNDIYANYYFALSLWKLGRIEQAKKYVDKVLAMQPKGVMKKYVEQASLCLGNYDACKAGQINFEESKTLVQQEGELDKFIRNDSTMFTKNVKTDFEQKHLDVLKYEINADKELDNYTFQKYKNYTRNKSEAEIKQSDAILQARELQYQQAMAMLNTQDNSNNILVNDVSALKDKNLTAEQINQMLNEKSTEIDAKYEMLPFLMSQNVSLSPQEGYSPEMIKTMLMNYNVNR